MNLQQDHYQSRLCFGRLIYSGDKALLSRLHAAAGPVTLTALIGGSWWVLALGSIKTVAKHDTQWKLQKHETHQVVERICERVSALLMGC